LTEYILHEWEVKIIKKINETIDLVVRLYNSMPINRGFKPMRKPHDSDIKNRVKDFLDLMNKLSSFVLETKEPNIIIDK
jgi:hypothetical protein